MNEKDLKDKVKRKRRNQVVIRFSDEEFEELNEAIYKSGLSRTEFFLKLLHGSNVVIIPDLQEICMELKKQGVNLNQALRFAYQTEFKSELEYAIKKCNELYVIAKKLCLSTDSKSDKARSRKGGDK